MFFFCAIRVNINHGLGKSAEFYYTVKLLNAVSMELILNVGDHLPIVLLF